MKTISNTGSLKKLDCENLHSVLSSLTGISRAINEVHSEEEVIKVLMEVTSKKIGFINCALFKIDEEKKNLQMVVSYFERETIMKQVKNDLKIKVGEGHVGRVALTKEPIIINDITKSKEYFKGYIYAQSEIVVPLIIDGEVYGVLSSEHTKKDFFHNNHISIIETILTFVSGALKRLKEVKRIEDIKRQLESVLQVKTQTIEKTVEKISKQHEDLKQYNQNQEILIQEVHHRVNNTLQTICSILRLYLTENIAISEDTFKEVNNKVKVMALVHQEIYKSIEEDKINVNNFINEVTDYLLDTTQNDLKVHVEKDIAIDYLSIDSLIPLGLLLTEIHNLWVECSHYHNLGEIKLSLQLKKEATSGVITLTLKDMLEHKIASLPEDIQNKRVNRILISALTEQLNGKLIHTYNQGNIVTIQFQEEKSEL